MHDIIDTAVAAGSFKTLAAAVTAAGLVPTLKGAGMNGKSAATVNGAMVSISNDDGVHLNGLSKVVTTDIECTNGVIHVIDSVLLPPTA